MDFTRLAVLIALAGGALVDILIAVYLTLVGALAYAINKPADPKSIAIFVSDGWRVSPRRRWRCRSFARTIISTPSSRSARR